MAEKEVDLLDYFNLFLRYKYLIVTILVIFASLGFIFYKYEVPTYTATTHLVVGKETIGKTYDIASVQKTGTIVTLAKSYPFVYNVVEKLNLTRHPIKRSLINRIFHRKPVESSDLRRLALYYKNNIDVKSKRGSNILVISARAQDPKIAADLANSIGSMLIAQSVKQKESIINTNIGYIDEQLESLLKLITQNRGEKDQKETSLGYRQVSNLQDQLEIQQNALSLFLKEKEYLIFSIAMAETIIERMEAQARLDYVESKIIELQSSIDADKDMLREMDKIDIYGVEDLEFSIVTHENMYQNLMGEKQKIVLAALIESKDLRFLNPAYVPINPDKMRGIILILIFIGIGAAVAFGMIESIEVIHRSFRSSHDVEEKLGMKVIGNVPKAGKKEPVLIQPKNGPKSIITESYRTLATNIKFATRDNNIKSILFTSDKPGTGKSVTIANLASEMADSGSRILMVDVDLRRPSLHKIFKINRKPGLTGVLAGKAKLKDAVVKVRDNLYLLPAGELCYNPQSIIESKAMKAFIIKCRNSYDFVFCDSIPITSFSDVSILASIIDASVLVMGEKKSERTSMEFAKERLADIGSVVLGVVINKSKNRYRKYHYYYYYREKDGKKK